MIDERKEEEAKALDDFFGDEAIDAFVDNVGAAFSEIAGPDVPATELLKNVLDEVCQTKESRQEFV